MSTTSMNKTTKKMNGNAHSTRSVPKRDGVRRMRVSKDSMNRLVMDYLIGKGYKDVAEAFWRDSGTKPHVALESIQSRMDIQQLLLAGEISKAREKLLDIDKAFFKTNDSIEFLLAKQELIELIRIGDISGALRFATLQLAPLGESNPHYLHEIEQTMALLAFQNHAECPLGFLLEHTQRRRVAEAVNQAILRTQKQVLEPMLPTMVRQLNFMEKQLHDQSGRRPTGIFRALGQSKEEETEDQE